MLDYKLSLMLFIFVVINIGHVLPARDRSRGSRRRLRENENGLQCHNSLSKSEYIVMYSKDGVNLGRMTSCRKLFRKHPVMCERTRENLQEPEDAIGGTGGKCCEACGDVTCLDKLTKSSPLVISGNKTTSIKSCNSLVKNYRVLCRKHGIPGGACCRTCAGVDTRCVDELRTFHFGDRSYRTCSILIYNNPCLCEHNDIADSCCASCARVDMSQLFCNCRDTVDERRPITVTIRDADGNISDTKTLASCDMMVQQYPNLCGNFGGLGRSCCRSCQNLRDGNLNSNT